MVGGLARARWAAGAWQPAGSVSGREDRLGCRPGDVELARRPGRPVSAHRNFPARRPGLADGSGALLGRGVERAPRRDRSQRLEQLGLWIILRATSCKLQAVSDRLPATI